MMHGSMNIKFFVMVMIASENKNIGGITFLPIFEQQGYRALLHGTIFTFAFRNGGKT
jgi:hypothetical protein